MVAMREGAAMAALVQIHAVQPLRQLSCHHGANNVGGIEFILILIE